MFSDPQFWVFVAFIIFVIAIFKPVKKILTLNLDNKIKEIKNNINKAENIKSEAQQILSKINIRQNDLKQEIQDIQNKSKERMAFIEQQFQQKLNEQIIKRNALAKIRIEQMTRDANMQVQQYIADNTIKATIKILEKKLDQFEKQELINQSISELNSSLNIN